MTFKNIFLKHDTRKDNIINNKKLCHLWEGTGKTFSIPLETVITFRTALNSSLNLKLPLILQVKFRCIVVYQVYISSFL